MYESGIRFDPETGEIIEDQDWEQVSKESLVREIQAQAAYVDAVWREIERLRGYKERLLARLEKLKSRLLMEIGGGKLQLPHLGITVYPVRTDRVVISVPVEQLPAELVRFYPPVPPKPEPDKAAIKKALKSGREIPGCGIVENISLGMRKL